MPPESVANPDRLECHDDEAVQPICTLAQDVVETLNLPRQIGCAEPEQDDARMWPPQPDDEVAEARVAPPTAFVADLSRSTARWA